MHWICLAIAIAAPLWLGCASVRPWEREVLARAEMAWEPDPLQASLESHIHFSKEAALVGGGSAGGGCGCN